MPPYNLNPENKLDGGPNSDGGVHTSLSKLRASIHLSISIDTNKYEDALYKAEASEKVDLHTSIQDEIVYIYI